MNVKHVMGSLCISVLYATAISCSTTKNHVYAGEQNKHNINITEDSIKTKGLSDKVYTEASMKIKSQELKNTDKNEDSRNFLYLIRRFHLEDSADETVFN